ncbi:MULTISPECIES: plasmid transfer protein TraA [Actinomycetes]|uniref:plasmid transfer protein TraA n=1 Tax=Actinomycetes TaxID=1760 RepID=UPI000C9B173C|nr:plasmid transfer protein TraA [Streptomyces noursei]
MSVNTEKPNVNKMDFNFHFGKGQQPGFWQATAPQNNKPAAGNPNTGRGVTLESMLPEPDFSSPAATRRYCNELRALMFGLAIEIGMAAEILDATLAQVPDPDGKAFGSKLRARRVAAKLRKAAESAVGVAKNAAATHSKFTQEFEPEINAVRHRAKPRQQRRQIDWANQ